MSETAVTRYPSADIPEPPKPMVVAIVVEPHGRHKKQRLRISRSMAASLVEALVGMLAETRPGETGVYEIEVGI